VNAAVDHYLNELSWAMGGRFEEQQAARDELRAHITDAVRDYELQGVPQAEAVARVLRETGDPTQVGRALRESRGRSALRRPLAQPEGAVLLYRRPERHLPAPRLAFAVAGLAVALAFVALVYAWPS
jgi:hypothetical protein